MHDGMDGGLSAHAGAKVSNSSSVIAASAPPTTKSEEVGEDSKDRAVSANVFGDLPEAKRRKFILVDDPERNSRVRVRVMLENVDMTEIPDSYRKSNSVYPRSYFPIQMQSPRRRTSRGNRFFEDEEEEGGSRTGDGDGEEPVMGRTVVPVPMPEGVEAEVGVPRIGRAKRRREVLMNDLGYRMSWSQSRVFAGRTMFLQRAR